MGIEYIREIFCVYFYVCVWVNSCFIGNFVSYFGGKIYFFGVVDGCWIVNFYFDFGVDIIGCCLFCCDFLDVVVDQFLYFGNECLDCVVDIGGIGDDIICRVRVDYGYRIDCFIVCIMVVVDDCLDCVDDFNCSYNWISGFLWISFMIFVFLNIDVEGIDCGYNWVRFGIEMVYIQFWYIVDVKDFVDVKSVYDFFIDYDISFVVVFFSRLKDQSDVVVKFVCFC